MSNLDFKMIKSRVFVSSIMNDICHTEPKAKYLNKFILKNSSMNFLNHTLPKQVRLSLTKDGSS